jgi:RNase adaptor protein for sRNA GlmZ degradation
MFISNAEKNQMRESITYLLAETSRVKSEILFLTAKIKVLEGKTTEPKKPRKKHTMSPEGRARMSQMMKDRHAKNKLEKANATSISTTSI